MLASGVICLVLAVAVGGETIPDGKGCGQIPSGVNVSTIQTKHVPWLVQLRFTFKDNRTAYACVGSLVSPSIVLTSAHCVHRQQPFEVRVADCGDGSSCDIPVTSTTQHPAYSILQPNQANDVAILKLKSKVKQVNFACLPEATTPPSSLEGKQTFVAGWNIHKNGTDFPTQGINVRRVVPVSVIPTQQCEQLFGGKIRLQTSQLCAGGQGLAPCSGDSGAPLHVLEESRAIIIGTVSLGSRHCGNNTRPTVYSNIGAYVEWIKEQMADDN